MSNIPFLRPRLLGSRFADHAIPLEFLKDLAVLEEMIIEVARWEFLREHPERQRVRRGLTEGVALKLTGVEEGSAIPVINLDVTANTLFPLENLAYFERGRDDIIRAIDAAGQNRKITDYLPEKALGYFDRIGRSLCEGEAMEFSSPTQPLCARLTRETRRKLVLASSAVKEFTDDVSVRGLVPEADQDAMRFIVQLLDGRKVHAPMVTQHWDTILEAFSGYKSGLRVLLQGVGKHTRNGRLQEFESVEHISVLDPLDVPARLDELHELQDGWLDGKGRAPGKAGLDWLAEAFGEHFPDDLPLPYLYPTAEGGIQAEWSSEPWEITLEIDLERREGEWHALNMETGEAEERRLNLNEASGWQWQANEIRQKMGDVA